jgi:DNA-binding response OmpR family regulator
MPFELDDVGVHFVHPAGGEARFLVSTRNLSAGGISFLHAGFVHARTLTRILLPTLSDDVVSVPGRVAFCRHVDRTVHEVGVQFDDRIDPMRFIARCERSIAGDLGVSLELPQLHGDVLCLVDNDPEGALLRHHLRAAGMNVELTSDPEHAAALLAERPFDALILDLGRDWSDRALAAKPCERMRSVAVALSFDACPLAAQAEAMGIRVVRKPYEPAALLALLRTRIEEAGAAGGRLVSRLPADEDMAPLLVHFVQEARLDAPRLRSAIEQNDLETARSICRRLKATAGGYGFPTLSDAAFDAVTALDASASITESADPLHRVERLLARLHAEAPSQAENPRKATDAADPAA